MCSTSKIRNRPEASDSITNSARIKYLLNYPYCTTNFKVVNKECLLERTTEVSQGTDNLLHNVPIHFKSLFRKFVCMISVSFHTIPRNAPV